MSLSYSALTNHGKITLPSVDTWGTNMNLIKDPPKGITTRRIDKVGQTSSITDMIDDSGSRACEAILQYSRGVNPMVSVSYNNGKSMNGQGLQTNGSKQAFLPYRVNREGAFRPPINTQYNLLPLSRQPRIWTSSFTNKAFPDFSKKVMMQGDCDTTKEVKTKMLKASVRPTAVYKIETPLDKPYEVKYNIQQTLQKSANAGIKTTDRTTQHVLEPTKEINNNMSHAFAQSNIQDVKYVDNNNFNPDRYIQDANAHSVDTAKAANYIQMGNLDDFVDMGDVRVKDNINIDYQTALRGNEKMDYIHGDLFQERNLPYYTAESNMKGDGNKVTYIHDDIELDRTLPYYTAESNMKGDGNKVTYIHNDIQLDRTMPYHSAESNMRGDKKISYIHEDVYLERNVPEYNIDATIRGNDKVTYIHDDVQLERVLPEYVVNSAKTQPNMQKILEYEYIKKMNGSVPSITDVYVNKTGQGESNVSSRNYQLADKLQAGSYYNSGSMPSLNRTSNVKENFETDKAIMNRKVIDQHFGRFESLQKK